MRQHETLQRAQLGLESAKSVLAQKFEHGERLAALAARLDEIDQALGIGESAKTSAIEDETPGKGDEGSALEVEEEVA